MKKLILLMLVLALGAFAMFSCKDNGGEQGGEGNQGGESGVPNLDDVLGGGDGGEYIDPDGWTTPNK